jgi:hypothetical protein
LFVLPNTVRALNKYAQGISTLGAWDINEDISEDEIPRAVPNEICMDFTFVPHFTVPSFWVPLQRSRPAPTSQRTKKTGDTAPEAFFISRW